MKKQPNKKWIEETLNFYKEYYTGDLNSIRQAHYHKVLKNMLGLDEFMYFQELINCSYESILENKHIVTKEGKIWTKFPKKKLFDIYPMWWDEKSQLKLLRKFTNKDLLEYKDLDKDWSISFNLENVIALANKTKFKEVN